MADLSPEFASEIQKLEANYASNPGRFFVPLASQWRDAGDIATAERILRENISKFPGLSAHVLLGRCLADRGAFPEAANEFHYVLSIDSQNLIALRTLAEMAAAGGRRADAERWYNELLAVDPMNVEARTALQQLARGGAAPAAPAAAAEPAWGNVDIPSDEPASPATGADDGEFGMIDLSAPDASPADASGVAADDSADLGEWGDLALDAPDEAPAAQPAAAAEGGDFDAFGFVDLDAEPAGSPADAGGTGGWMDADARQDLGESAAADAGELPLLDAGYDDGMVDAPLAGADLPLLDLDDTVQDAGLSAAASEPGAGFGFGEPEAFDDAGHVAHEEDGHDREAEMVTETMAELYASQGLHAQAADVYRELIRQRGEEPGLVRRLAELESRLEPASAGSADFTFPAESAGDTPDWLQSVDAFARGGTTPEPSLDAGVPGLELSPAQVDETLAEPAQADASAADEFPAFEPAAAEEFASYEPAGIEFTPPFSAAGEDAPEPAGAASSASADPFADSFAGGFDGSAEPASPEPSFAEPAFAEAGASADAGESDDGRQAWEAPTVAETEPVGFDILVVEDEDGTQVPAPAEVVADVSADWAIAAAPLEDDEEAAEAELAASAPAAPAFTAPAYETSAPGSSRTMRGYFSSLLAWQPAPPAAAVPTYEVTADESGALTIEAAAPEAPMDSAPAEAPAWESAAADEPLPYETAAPDAELPSFDAPPLAAAPEIPTFEAPSFQPPAPAFGGLEPEAPQADEPWAAPASAEDEPWAAAGPGESAPQASAAPAPEELPMLDLEEPWAEAPAAPGPPVELSTFELAEDEPPAASPELGAPPAPAAEPAAADADAEELLPWEVPAEPSAAAPEPAAETNAGGFSFEDFFSGAPAEPAESAPAAAPEPEMHAPPAPEPAPAFIPSFAEPTPPPVFAEPAPAFTAPAPPPAAPPAPAASGAQDEEDEDLESFQAWLQSLKR